MATGLWSARFSFPCFFSSLIFGRLAAGYTNSEVSLLCSLPEERKSIAGKCPAFAEGICPFAGCKSVGEFQEKLGEMRDQCKGDGAPQEFQWPAVMPTSQHEEAELGRDCPFFSGKQGCPFAHGKDILSPYNAAVSVSKLWQLERTGTIASFFGCAYDSTLHFVCSLPKIVYPYNRIVCCLLIRSRHVLWDKHQSTHKFSFIRDSSLWYITFKSSLGELHAKHPQFSSFRLK